MLHRRSPAGGALPAHLVLPRLRPCGRVTLSPSGTQQRDLAGTIPSEDGPHPSPEGTLRCLCRTCTHTDSLAGLNCRACTGPIQGHSVLRRARMHSVTLSFRAPGSGRETQPLCLNLLLKTSCLWCGPTFWYSSRLHDLILYLPLPQPPWLQFCCCLLGPQIFPPLKWGRYPVGK